MGISRSRSPSLQYLTDQAAIKALIPDCFNPAKDPLVTVLFSQNNGLEFMAGGGYRLAAFQVAVTFDGDKDHVEGDLILVMLENQTWPILGGREDLGVPKLFADIPAMRRSQVEPLNVKLRFGGICYSALKHLL